MKPILFIAALPATSSIVPAQAPRAESSSVWPPEGTIEGEWMRTWRSFTFDPIVEVKYPRMKLNSSFNAEKSMPNANQYGKLVPRVRYALTTRAYNSGSTF